MNEESATRVARSLIGPAVAGSWYSADAETLRREVDELLDAVQSPEAGPDVVALIEPHAGFRYSGLVAARGFREVRGRRVERVVVIGPSHYAGFQGAVVPDADAYSTPLGKIPLDRTTLETLRIQPGFRTDTRTFDREHSVEAELPFLQRALAPGWRLTPILIGAGTRGAAAREVAEAVGRVAGPETLLVISSDFTHFGRSFGYVPFHEQVPERIRQLDLGAVDQIRAWDADGFDAYVARTGATVCGRDAIGVLLRALPKGMRADLVAYDTSGRMTGDWSHTVSYAAIVVRAVEAST